MTAELELIPLAALVHRRRPVRVVQDHQVGQAVVVVVEKSYVSANVRDLAGGGSIPSLPGTLGEIAKRTQAAEADKAELQNEPKPAQKGREAAPSERARAQGQVDEGDHPSTITRIATMSESGSPGRLESRRASFPNSPGAARSQPPALACRSR